MKYKASKTYKDLENRHFSYGTQKTLLRGGSVELDSFEFKKLPKSIKDELEPLEKTQSKVSKKDTIKDRKGDK